VDFSLKKNERHKHVKAVCKFFQNKMKDKTFQVWIFLQTKNERQKLRMWRKKMEDQNTASGDSSLNKIKDKTS
jgi:hypothetical protein